MRKVAKKSLQTFTFFATFCSHKKRCKQQKTFLAMYGVLRIFSMISVWLAVRATGGRAQERGRERDVIEHVGWCLGGG